MMGLERKIRELEDYKNEPAPTTLLMNSNGSMDKLRTENNKLRERVEELEAEIKAQSVTQTMAADLATHDNVRKFNENYLKPNKEGRAGIRGVFGDANDFLGGLDSLSGRPKVMMTSVTSADFDRKLELEMKHEILGCQDLDICQIRTSNYEVQTDLATEWEYVVNPDFEKKYPGEGGYDRSGEFTGTDPFQQCGVRLGRRKSTLLSDYINHYIARAAQLTRPEVIMAIFYTGKICLRFRMLLKLAFIRFLVSIPVFDLVCFL